MDCLFRNLESSPTERNLLHTLFATAEKREPLVINMCQFKQLKKIRLLLILAIIVSSSNTLLVAGTNTGQLSVSAVVSANCLVQNSTLNFGVYDPISANSTTPANATGGLQMRCTKNTVATISMSSGQHASHASSGASRAMLNGDSNNYLSYEIYTDGSHTTIWNESNRVTHAANSSALATINVYAKIPADQDVLDGTYTDSITVTAIF